jgi:glycosyltransferase involved in cell wall biosynthesis
VVARAALRWGARFVAQSAEEKERLLALLPKAQATIFPLPVLDLFAEQQMPRDKARKQLGLAIDVPVLLFFGIVREYKGLKDLLFAMPEIHKRLGPVTLLVAGEFWEDKHLYLEMIQNLDIADLVLLDSRYIPNEELGVFFSAADVLVAPYRQVTGSAVLQLARGFGLPVVTTHIGGIPEVVGSELGLLVPPGNPEALATAIIRYFDDNLRLTFQGRIDQQRERFSWEQLVATIEELAQEART